MRDELGMFEHMLAILKRHCPSDVHFSGRALAIASLDWPPAPWVVGIRIYTGLSMVVFDPDFHCLHFLRRSSGSSTLIPCRWLASIFGAM